MSNRLFALALILCAVVGASCRKDSGTLSSSGGRPEVGALYSLSDGEGGYRVGRIVAAEEEVVFVSLFANRWSKRPALTEARQASTPITVAYSPPTFAGMQPIHLEKGTPSAEETEAFESWKSGKRETF